MKDSQLEKYTVEELQDLGRRVEARMTALKQQARVELRERLAREALAAGYSIGDLFGGRRNGRATKAKTPGSATYQNPDDPTQTWSGRGRRPKWLSDSGTNIERFRVR